MADMRTDQDGRPPEPVAGDRFLALGDSLTEGRGDPDGATGFLGWPLRLLDQLRPPAGTQLVNLARRNADVRDVRDRQLAKAPAGRAALVSIIVGVNDVCGGYRAEVFRQSFDGLLRAAARPARRWSPRPCRTSVTWCGCQGTRPNCCVPGSRTRTTRSARRQAHVAHPAWTCGTCPGRGLPSAGARTTCIPDQPATGESRTDSGKFLWHNAIPGHRRMADHHCRIQQLARLAVFASPVPILP